MTPRPAASERSEDAGYGVLIAGAGGMAREAAAWLEDEGRGPRLRGFVVAPGHAHASTLFGATLWDDLERAVAETGARGIVLAVGSPAIRVRLLAEVAAHGLAPLTVVHPTAYVGPGVELGPGTIIAPNATLTRDIHVGSAAIVNYSAAVGHDCRLGTGTFVGPGSTLGGDVQLENEVLVGLGATVLPGTRVGARAVLGAGSVVTRDVDAGATMVGVPARPRP